MKNNIKEKIKILLVNIVVSVFCILILELIFFSINYKKYMVGFQQEFPSNYLQTISFDERYPVLKQYEGEFRRPEGLNYTKKPIIIFGCSFALGDRLKTSQTFSYKLSHYTKRPVYNRSACSWSMQHMLYQLRRKDFYKEVKEPEYIVYVFIAPHIERMYSYTTVFPYNNNICLRYENRNGGLEQVNPRFNFIYRLNIFYNLLMKKTYDKAKNPANFDKNFNFMEQYFLESKKEAGKHWHNTKFVILKYNDRTSCDDPYYKSKRWKELEKEGFIVVDSKDLVGKTFREREYFADDNFHPSEKVWNLVVPEFTERFKL